MKSTAAGHAGFRPHDQARILPGMSLGMRQPAIILVIDVSVTLAKLVPSMVSALNACAGCQMVPQAGEDPLRMLVENCGHIAVQLQRTAALPVLESHRVRLLQRDATKSSYELAIPYWDANGCSIAIKSTLSAVSALLATWNTPASAASRTKVASQFQASAKQLAKLAIGSSNVPRFLKAAYDLKVPWEHCPSQVVRFGQGAKSRLMKSSLTDATASIGVAFAHDKAVSAQVMRAAGLPVPLHRLVRDAEQAVAAANDIGYPVVVKPTNCEQGKGVFTDLRDADAVKQAHQQASAFSASILVEKQIVGRDYRLVVFQGELVWAVERVPGGVAGDGQQTVAQLIERTNQNPLRGHGNAAVLKTLHLDDEAVQWLGRQQLDAQSVPETGRFVRLRGAANQAAGGVPVAVLPQVHPDNRLLAERAAAALRLDLAGVDLLISDIAESWLLTGGGICEINAQPSLGFLTSSHLYTSILKSLLSGGSGRIPITAIVGGRHGPRLAVLLEAAQQRQGIRVGILAPDGIRINGIKIAHRSAGFCFDGRVLLADTQVDSMIVLLDDIEMLADGLPFDALDHLVFADSSICLPRGSAAKQATTIATTLMAACSGTLVCNQQDEGCVTWASWALQGRVLRTIEPGCAEESIPEVLLASVLAQSAASVK